MDTRKYFASDNNSGVHPRILEAIGRANHGSTPAYGADDWTAEAVEHLKQAFGEQADPWFVLLGTAANVLGLKCLVRSHHAILCPENAHINTDECAAPEAIIGCKLIPLPAPDGKINLEYCEKTLWAREEVHHPYPLVLSITQCTEFGTVYSLEELKRVGEFCRTNKLYFHMDGARLTNAAAHLGTSLKALSTDVGVDVLSFGGTKNGLMLGEVVLFLNPELGRDFAYVRKQHMQLSSKMRFVAAQFTEFLKDGLWRENASRANAMASLLAEKIKNLDLLKIVHPVQANIIFARMHRDTIAKLHKEFYFYIVDENDALGYPKDWPMVRLMTSFNSTEEQVREFARALNAAG